MDKLGLLLGPADTLGQERVETPRPVDEHGGMDCKGSAGASDVWTTATICESLAPAGDSLDRHKGIYCPRPYRSPYPLSLSISPLPRTPCVDCFPPVVTCLVRDPLRACRRRSPSRYGLGTRSYGPDPTIDSVDRAASEKPIGTYSTDYPRINVRQRGHRLTGGPEPVRY